MIQITQDIAIDEGEIYEEFIRASGPGGQHVNRAATAVQLRFDAANSPSLPEPVRERLTGLAGHRMTEDGLLIIEARQFRSQDRNRKAARNRLGALIRQAVERPKTRRGTEPPRASKERRLREKYGRSEIKRLRRSPREY